MRIDCMGVMLEHTHNYPFPQIQFLLQSGPLLIQNKLVVPLKVFFWHLFARAKMRLKSMV